MLLQLKLLNGKKTYCTEFALLQLSTGVEIEPPPAMLKVEFQTILTPETVQFLAELVSTFDEDVEEVCLSWRVGVVVDNSTCLSLKCMNCLHIRLFEEN